MFNDEELNNNKLQEFTWKSSQNLYYCYKQDNNHKPNRNCEIRTRKFVELQFLSWKNTESWLIWLLWDKKQ